MSRLFQKRFLSVSVIIITLIISYSNSTHCTWHFDDEQNILLNETIHITDLSYSSLKSTLYAHLEYPGEKMYRPVSLFTLGLNWYFGQDNVYGYHLVNIAIHIVTAIALFFCLLTISDTPNMTSFNRGNAIFVALTGTLLWALNPVQTQAVTYIVQRMASLATMFYLLAILFYLYGRIALILPEKLFYFSGVFVLFFLSLGSKENAITLPFILVMAEVIFFADLQNKRVRKIILRSLLALIMVCLLAIIFIFVEGSFSSWLNTAYEGRFFSLSERLLTESRIVVKYISQIFYPIPPRLSLSHDVVVSRSLVEPWTTFPSIILLMSLALLGAVSIKKNPLLAFAILFFLINHVVESTILPLELVFEHRNYLPSLFLFAPVASFVKSGINRYCHEIKYISSLLTLFIIVIIIMFGAGTYIRNFDWMTTQSLWFDALKKAPNSFRPAYFSALWLQDNGYPQQALPLFERSFNFAEQARDQNLARVFSLLGISSIYLVDGQLDKGIYFLNKTLEIDNKFEPARKNLILALLRKSEVNRAVDVALQLLTDFPEKGEYNYLYAIALSRAGENDKALYFINKAIQLDPANSHFDLVAGAIYKKLELYNRAKELFFYSNTKKNKKIHALLAILEISVITHDNDLTEQILEKLTRQYDPNQIQAAFDENTNYYFLISVFSEDKILPLLSDFF
jgi:tetratricopeptide (TPR) repeat protein